VGVFFSRSPLLFLILLPSACVCQASHPFTFLCRSRARFSGLFWVTLRLLAKVDPPDLSRLLLLQSCAYRPSWPRFSPRELTTFLFFLIRPPRVDFYCGFYRRCSSDPHPRRRRSESRSFPDGALAVRMSQLIPVRPPKSYRIRFQVLGRRSDRSV